MPNYSDLAGTTGGFLVGGELETTGGIVPRIVTLTDASTVTPNANLGNLFILTTLSQDTTIANPTGTPINYQELTIRIASSSARKLTWGSLYQSSLGLPVSTSGGSKEDYFSFRYNTLDSKWDLVFTSQGLPDQQDFAIEAPVVKKYPILVYPTTGATITGASLILSSGTLTADIDIGVTPITGLAPLSVGSTAINPTASGANNVTSGQIVWIDVTSISSPVMLAGTLRFTRT